MMSQGKATWYGQVRKTESAWRRYGDLPDSKSAPRGNLPVFLWKSSFRQGDNGTEHNDSWLRFPNASDFFGEKASNGSIVYPNGSGKEPNPEGSSSDGWFKIYRSGDRQFIFVASKDV